MYAMDPTNKTLYSYVCYGPNKPPVNKALYTYVCYGSNK